MTQAGLTPERAAKYIDHTLLQADAGTGAIRRLCAQALEHGFYSVCVNPCFVTLCAKELAGSAVKVGTTVGFPLGANTTAVKVAEAEQAVADGALELDMVMALYAAKNGAWDLVEQDIAAVVKAAAGVPVKVILETCYLDLNEKVSACRAAEAGGAAFVKTSTGFGAGGALVEDVSLMRATVSAAVKVKASGGIRNATAFQAMIAAGAERVGASAGIAILAELGAGS